MGSMKGATPSWVWRPATRTIANRAYTIWMSQTAPDPASTVIS